MMLNLIVKRKKQQPFSKNNINVDTLNASVF